MPIAAGSHLGPYEIVSLIGAGGMGEVYRARDTRLERIVAIKVLPAHLADNPDLRERFEREAKTIAGLNHPHICTLHDIGRQDGIDFLVMEYLEGETLSMRLLKGPLPLEQVLRYAIEIADALDKAHRKSVTHRDVKPGNIMLTKNGSKLLDFGLAKLKQEAAPANVPFSQLPTAGPNAGKDSLTVHGTILGTLQYMAPEQVEGKIDEIDGRTDIFAFGAVVHEMATGKKAFEGKSSASMIGAILKDEPPPISALQPMTPPTLDRVVKKCLAKDPEERWQHAHDLMSELKWIAESGTRPAPVKRAAPSRARVAWLSAAIVSLLAITLAASAFYFSRNSQQPEQIQFLIPTSNAEDTYGGSIATSPDGRWIVIVGSTSANTTALFVRQLGSTAFQELDDTSGASSLFWSPDSRYIGFFANDRMKKVSLSGGPPQDIGHTPGNRYGGTWNRDGTILFSLNNLLYRTSAEGGEPVTITINDPQGESFGFFPHFLPDGRHFLYLSKQEGGRGIYIGSLDSKETKRILDAFSKAIYVEPGYLLYQRDGTLFAQPFDAEKLELTGEPIRIANQVSFSAPTGNAIFSASDNGLLIYRSGGAATNFRFLWFDRTGKQLASASEPAPYRFSFDLSPNEKQFVVSLRGDLWLVEWARGIATRLSSDSADESDVVWSPDGLRVAYTSDRKGHQDIYEREVGGLGQETLLLETDQNKWVEDWSRDGRYIVYVAPGGEYVLPLFGDRKPFPIVKALPNSTVNEPHFSPDGKWLVYDSNESGTWQVYAVSFPSGEQKHQISVNGGVQPRWRRDGKEVYFLALDGKLMAADISSGAQIESGTPRALFDTHLAVDPSHDQYAVTGDGQRFLLRVPITETAPITAVVNWTAGLPK